MGESTTKSVSLKAFQKWPFKDDFKIKEEKGHVVSAKCKFCSHIDRETYLNEAKRRGLKGSGLKGAISYIDGVFHNHRTNFSKHVGDANSIHSWAKQRVLGTTPETPSGMTASTAHQHQRSYRCSITEHEL